MGEMYGAKGGQRQLSYERIFPPLPSHTVTDETMKRKRRFRGYPSDLTRDQWHGLQPWLPGPQKRGRPRQVALRAVLNAIRSVLRTGCAWRYLPRDFPRWQTVYGYFRAWQHLHEALRPQVRRQAGRPAPQRGHPRQAVGQDHRGGRTPRLRCRPEGQGPQRPSVVDTMGWLLDVVVHEAHIQDRDGATFVLAHLRNRFPRLQLSVVRAVAPPRPRRGKKPRPRPPGSLQAGPRSGGRLRVAEIRGLRGRFVRQVPVTAERVLAWSYWRCCHQGIARGCH